MAAGILAGGVDLDSLFDLYTQGTVSAPTTGIRVGGTDIRTRYAPIAYGTKRANVGYRVNGVDISNYFAAKGTATYGSTGGGGGSGGTQPI